MVILVFYLLMNEKNKVIKTFASSKEEFIEKFKPYAIKAALKYQIDPYILIVQAGLETGWGKRVIDNNFFNIKATKAWKKSGRDTVKITTHEYISKNQKIKIIDEFRKYNSIEESIEDFINLISTSNRYKEAWKNRNNYRLFFKALQKGGYATDPEYANKLIKIYEAIT